MTCQKCAKPAIVHLTEIIKQSSTDGGSRRTVEIHLCLTHAIEAGVLTPTTEPATQVAKPVAPPSAKEAARPETESAAIIQKKSEPAGMVVRKPADPSDKYTCPTCGISWNDFKHAGVMGCTHDYEFFATKLAPLIKRAHEGGMVHTGKVPAKRKPADNDRDTTTLRLQHELQKAVDSENYEQAARLRDQMRKLES